MLAQCHETADTCGAVITHSPSPSLWLQFTEAVRGAGAVKAVVESSLGASLSRRVNVMGGLNAALTAPLLPA